MSKNRNICHSCRSPGHWMQDCPTKQQCPRCGKGYLRWLEVYRTDNVGKLFYSCSLGCGYFDWDQPNMKSEHDEGESSGSSSNKSKGVDENMDLSGLLKTLAAITEESNVKLSLKLTIEKGKGSSDEKGKGKM